jgi:hypothetical protein
MLAHLAGQMGQHLVALGYLNLERSVPHTLNHGSIDGDHIFFWNGAYLLFERGKVAGLAASFGFKCCQRTNAMPGSLCKNAMKRIATELFRS